jgi:hypothetical protein
VSILADAEKILEKLKVCIESGLCFYCEYKENISCRHFLLRDAIRVIEDQQEEINRLSKQLDEAMLWR